MSSIKIPDYFRYYRSRTTVLFAFAQVITTVVSVWLAWFLWQPLGYSGGVALLVGLGTLILLQLLLSPLITSTASKPLRVLWQAIAHVSDEPVQTPPPELNEPGYEQSGLKALVDTIYELAAKQGMSSAATGTPEAIAASLAQHILERLPCGVIVLGAHGDVNYSNHVAPINIADDKQSIELLFDQSDTLETWLQDCQANKLRDTKIWRRIADRLPGQEKRRVFDIIATYAKNDPAGIETVLVTIDRTAEYAPEDEDMDFIALAAHELRGPITVIRGYLDIISTELGPQLAPDQQELITRLQVSAERLTSYVNNVLNVSRYDRNVLKLHLHEEHLLAIIQSLVPDLALRAKAQNRRLTFHVNDSLPTIAADRSSLSEVIINLIDNALKYSRDSGEVIVSAEPKGDFVEVTVKDSGIGMPESVVRNLFNTFYRSSRSRQQVSGTGLGLYSCKAIVQSHGGTIWVRSKEGEGTTFGFTMPTYASVADKLAKSDNSNEQIIERADGWIKNHAMYRR